MVTLHAYFLRELLKQFILAQLALTALVTLGGGVYNMLRQQGLGASDLVTVIPWLIPIVVTITLPIAALFAATLTYGRLAADNEFVACRAAGINVHRLFLPAILLSVFVSLFVLVSANFVIPQLSKAIEHYTRKNIRTFMFSQMRSRGYVHLAQAFTKRPILLTAQEVREVPESLLAEKGFAASEPGMGYLLLVEPRLLIMEESDLRSYSTAKVGLCQFDSRSEKLSFTLYLRDATNFEIGRHAAHVEEQQIGPLERDFGLPVRPAMLDLVMLYEWRVKPWLDTKLGAEMDRFLDRARTHLFIESCMAAVQGHKPIILKDISGKTCEVTAREFDPEKHGLALQNVTVRVRGADGVELERYEAPEAQFKPHPAPGEEPTIEIRLIAPPGSAVKQIYARDGGPLVRDRPTLSLDFYRMPQTILDAMRSMTPEVVLSKTPLDLDPRVADERPSLRATARSVQLKVDSLIHSRLSYSVSALVTVLMGAVLGVIFRGGHPLAALGLGCIPFGVIFIMGKTGENMAANERLHGAGIGLMWGVLAAMALANWLILRLGVRR